MTARTTNVQITHEEGKSPGTEVEFLLKLRGRYKVLTSDNTLGINDLVTQSTKFAITPQEKYILKYFYLEEKDYSDLSPGNLSQFCRIRLRKGYQ